MTRKPESETFSHTLEIKVELEPAELEGLNEPDALLRLLGKKDIDVEKTLADLYYERELERLQIELVNLQKAVRAAGRRVAILFEGRDAAGKSSAIRRFMENLSPRSARIVALPKPTELELGQWYFQRYIEQLPNAGEIVLFDRSWYNRAVVEPVMGYCSEQQYHVFMQQAPGLERMLADDGFEIVKLWFMISREVQRKRFQSRQKNPLKQWKLSPVDDEAQKNWDVYTHYIEAMFAKTHTREVPWTIVDANDKSKARLESIRYVLMVLDYAGKNSTGSVHAPDPEVIRPYGQPDGDLGG
jgi:polyphosphate kinase 2